MTDCDEVVVSFSRCVDVLYVGARSRHPAKIRYTKVLHVKDAFHHQWRSLEKLQRQAMGLHYSTTTMEGWLSENVKHRS